MWQPIKVEFVALSSVSADAPPHPGSKRGGKSKPAQTLVIFMGPDFAFGAATRKLIGAEGEALIKRAAGATKFRGKELTALDIVAPSGFAADRLLVIGPAARKAKAKSGKDECRQGRERRPIPRTRAPRPPITSASAASSGQARRRHARRSSSTCRGRRRSRRGGGRFRDGMKLRAYKFDIYKTKKKEERGQGRPLLGSRSRTAAARARSQA